MVPCTQVQLEWTKDPFTVQPRCGYEITPDLPKRAEATTVLFTVLSPTPNTELAKKQAVNTVIVTEEK